MSNRHDHERELSWEEFEKRLSTYPNNTARRTKTSKLLGTPSRTGPRPDSTIIQGPSSQRAPNTRYLEFLEKTFEEKGESSRSREGSQESGAANAEDAADSSNIEEKGESTRIRGGSQESGAANAEDAGDSSNSTGGRKEVARYGTPEWSESMRLWIERRDRECRERREKKE